MSQILLQPANAMITLENVNKWYGQFHVLKNINLTVQPENGSFCVALQVPVNRQPFVVLIIWKNINRDGSR